jgi:hypothetical protein
MTDGRLTALHLTKIPSDIAPTTVIRRMSALDLSREYRKKSKELSKLNMKILLDNVTPSERRCMGTFRLCLYCRKRPAVFTILPCGHLVYCDVCINTPYYGGLVGMTKRVGANAGMDANIQWQIIDKHGMDELRKSQREVGLQDPNFGTPECPACGGTYSGYAHIKW